MMSSTDLEGGRTPKSQSSVRFRSARSGAKEWTSVTLPDESQLGSVAKHESRERPEFSQWPKVVHLRQVPHLKLLQVAQTGQHLEGGIGEGQDLKGTQAGESC